MTVQIVTDETYLQEISHTGQNVLVKFWATWCGPCKKLAPVVEQLAKEFPDLLVLAVDSDENPVAVEHEEVKTVPTLVLYRAGERVSTLTGVLPPAKLREALRAAKVI